MPTVTAKITQNIIKITMSAERPLGYYDGRFFIKYEWEIETDDASETEMLIDGIPLVVSANQSWLFDISLIGVDADTLDSKTWKFEGAIKRDESNNTSMVGTPNKEVPVRDSAASGWNADVSANDLSESLKIAVTGQVGKTIKWRANGLIIKVEL